MLHPFSYSKNVIKSIDIPHHQEDTLNKLDLLMLVLWRASG